MRKRILVKRFLSLAVCAAMLTAMVPAVAADNRQQQEPTLMETQIPWETVNGFGTTETFVVTQYQFTFTTVPENVQELAQYQADSPYKAMALLLLAFRTWTPEDPTICEQMLDLLTDTRVQKPDSEETYPFSEYKMWKDTLAARMKQNNKYRYIGNAYLGGAAPANDYTPAEPFTITLRESTAVPYKAQTETTPELWQVFVHPAGSDSERYATFYEDEDGNWRVWSDTWQGLLADVQTPKCDIPLPPEYEVPEQPANPQVEPEVSIHDVPVKASGVDEFGNPVVLDTTVKQYSFTFSTVPTCYEDIVQYELDSPYKTMALLILAFRTWTPENPTVCEQMLDYLTNTAVDSGQTDEAGYKLSQKFSGYLPWQQALKNRMNQNNKYAYIGNAYLEGAMPANDYTPTEPITITLRQSVYDPFREEAGTTPEIRQVLISLPGSDSDRYSLFYQDQRGDWRVWSDNWQGLLADVKTPGSAVTWPAEVVRSETPAAPQEEPVLTQRVVSAKVPLEDGSVGDTTVQEYTYTFSTIPTSYEDIVQYELNSPYKTMALFFLALRTWDPEHPETCAEMLDYLTNPAVEKPGSVDAEGHKLSYAFSEYYPWITFLRERMEQNDKYAFIGNAYLNGAAPGNDYTPTEPISITLRQSVYDPFREETETSPAIKQVLVSLAGDDNDRYSLLYQDQRGDWRIFGDNWKGLLADVKTPVSQQLWPAEVVRSDNPAVPQEEPVLTLKDVSARVPLENGSVGDITVKEYTYTFSTIPTSYEDIVQYELDSPYKTMALLLLALRTWTPEHPEICAEMLDYLTNPAVGKPGAVDAEGHKLSYAFSEYDPWLTFLRERMEQNDKYAFIGNAYLNGAAPENNYTPREPISITLRQSVYDPFREETDTTPEISQVLISLPGSDSDRYSLFYQDQRGDWRVWSDNWQGLLADVKPGWTPRIENAVRENGTVRFSVPGDSGAYQAFVAAYSAEQGKMLSVSAAREDNGICTAAIDDSAAFVRIFLLDPVSLRPLCEDLEL